MNMNMNMNMKIKVFYMIEASYENDYVKYDLFHGIDNIEFIDYTAKDPSHFQNIMNHENINNNSMIVMNTDYYTKELFTKVENMISNMKPLVIIWCSDQYGDREDILSLSQYTKVMFRQYIYKNYINKNIPNLIQIPLGYMSNMLNQKNSLSLTIKPINERKYIWSSIIKLKNDRLEMLNKFINAFDNNYYNTSGNVPLDVMVQIYSDSIFVPNGKGDWRLDCFRLYETSLLGSIPVVVGNYDLIEETFYYNNNKPPFVYADTWDNAIIKCRNLLENKSELDNIQKNILEWWKFNILNIRTIIQNTIEHQ